MHQSGGTRPVLLPNTGAKDRFLFAALIGGWNFEMGMFVKNFEMGMFVKGAASS